MSSFPLLRSTRCASVIVAAILFGTAMTGCSSASDNKTSSSGESSVAASSSDPAHASASSAESTAASGAGSSGSDAEEALPAALFEEDGMTLVEYSRQHPDAGYLDPATESVLEEAVGTGSQEITVDAQKGAVLRVILLCPSDATGKTDIHTSREGEDEKTWMAGSEGACGDWSAATAPVPEAGPMTFTVTVDNDSPFRVVLTALSE
ncbi:hypothetical protein [Micrococcus lylae]|uniref:hypothetical protein n=1 Tax=Micrococcus lylae TaxID=1273 RepID=UPI001FE8DD6A|nr:hypothetical protein [Micrococcus lylae]